MRTDTERLKINKRDTQKDGIEYPKSVERVMMTSAGRPRLHPEIRPRMIPSHMVAAVGTATTVRVVGGRGGDNGAEGGTGVGRDGGPLVSRRHGPGRRCKMGGKGRVRGRLP